MLPRLLILLALLVFAAGVVSARLTAPASFVFTCPEPSVPDQSVENPPHLGAGVSINFYHVDSVQHVLDQLDAIADMGFDSVQIVTPIFQEHGLSPAVAIEQRPGRGPTFDDLDAALQHAKKLGLRTSLLPQVNLTAPRGNEWRGKIRPDDWQPWWKSYRAIMLEFAKLAQRSDADVLVVGCELLTTLSPEHHNQWQRLIGECRARFHGSLTFSSTWDTFDRVGFWDQLDFIGISGYWDLTRDTANPEAPTDAELADRWRGIRARLQAFGRANRRPVLITEVGYPSLPWALSDPWNYVPKRNSTPDPAAQARGYSSFLTAWQDVRPTTTTSTTAASDSLWLGVFFYEWGLYTAGGPTDTGFTFRGKPAEPLLREWLNTDPVPTDIQ